MLYKATAIVSISYTTTDMELVYASEHIVLLFPHSMYHLHSTSSIHLRNWTCFCSSVKRLGHKRTQMDPVHHVRMIYNTYKPIT